MLFGVPLMRVVRGHERLGVAFDDAVAKVRQPVFVKHPLGDLRFELLAVPLDVVHRVMFERRGKFQITRIVALQSFDVSHAMRPVRNGSSP